MVSPSNDHAKENFSNGAVQSLTKTSPLKTRKRTHAFSLVSAAVLTSLLTACMTNQTKPNSGESAQVSQAPEEQNLAQQSSEGEAEQESSNSSAAESESNADQLMASLKAPVEEPMGQAPSEDVVKSAEEAGVPLVQGKVIVTTPKGGENVAEAATKAQDNAIQAGQAEVKNEIKEVLATGSEAAKNTVEKVEQAVDRAKVAAQSAVKEKVETVAPPTAAKKRGPAKPLSVTARDLPVNYDIWVLKKGETPLTQGLVISTPTWEMGREGYMSQIWLTLKEDELHVNSSSDIAKEVKNLGVSIDGGKLIPFNRIAENNIGIVKGDWMDKLAAAKSLDIYLGFFPGKKPTSARFKSSTSLDNLDRVVATYRKIK